MKKLFLLLTAGVFTLSAMAQERLSNSVVFGTPIQEKHQTPLTNSQNAAVRNMLHNRNKSSALLNGRTTNTGANNRWYEYFSYMDTSTGGAASNGTSGSSPYLWNDTSSTDIYTGASGGDELDFNTMVSISTVIDPYFYEFDNTTYYDSSVTTGNNGLFLTHWPTKNYVVDSINIYGLYGVNPSKTSVVDTVIVGITWGGAGGSTDMNIPSDFVWNALDPTLWSDYGIPTTDSFWWKELFYDSVSNAGSGTNYQQQYFTISKTGAVTNNHDTWYDTLSNGIWAKTIYVANASGTTPAPLGVQAGNIVGVTISFKSGDASHTFGDTVFTGDAPNPYRYNMFRPLIEWYSNGSTTNPTPIFPTYPKVPPSATYQNAATTILSGTDFNEGLYKELPNYYNGWENVYIPQWGWTSGSAGTAAADLQYPLVDIHVVCSACGTTSTVSAVPNTVAPATVVKAYPDPAANELNISFSGAQGPAVSVTLTNMIGQVVATQNMGNVSSGNAVFNTAALPSGVYIYSVLDSGDRTTGHVVISH